MFIFLDTKTTGKDEDDRLCQIAFKTEAKVKTGLNGKPGQIRL